MLPHLGLVLTGLVTISLVMSVTPATKRRTDAITPTAVDAYNGYGSASSHTPGRGGPVAGCDPCATPRRVVTDGPAHAQVEPTPRVWRPQRRIRNTGSLSAQSAPPERPLGEIFGVGSYFVQRSVADASTVIPRAHLAGAGWVREELTATELHDGSDSSYRWGPYDRVVNMERRAGLHVLGLLDYSNTWGYADHGVMLHDDMSRLSTDYARYAYRVAYHYRGRIQYWELWNEPNLPQFWHPAPSPSDYAMLVDAASRAIKRANPHARIVLGGTSGVDLNFIRAVAAETDAFDVVAVHPYRAEPETELMAQVHALQALGKPIWFTEIGWPAGAGCGACPDEREQASDLVRFYALAAAGGVQRVFWYDFRDDAYGATNQEKHFGLVRHNLSAKPAFTAYAFLAHTLTGARFVAADRLGDGGLYALRFRRGNSAIELLWNVGLSPSTVRIPWAAPHAVIVGAGGVVLNRVKAQDGAITLELPPDGAPLYVLERDPTYRVPLAAMRPIVAAPVRHGRPQPRRPRVLPHSASPRPASPPPTREPREEVAPHPRPHHTPTAAPPVPATPLPALATITPTPSVSPEPTVPTASPMPSPQPEPETATATSTTTATATMASPTLSVPTAQPTVSTPTVTPVP